MKFSTGLPNCREGRQNPMGSVDREAIENAARVADELGYFALWPNEFFVSRPDVSARYNQPPNLFDATITIAYALATTRRIRVMPSVLILPLHEPIALARQFATLDVFSGGRVTMGIGLGGTKEEFGRMRADNPNRSKLMDEQVEAMRVLWSEPQATYQGDYVRFDGLETYPKPLQEPLPILRAGHGDAALTWIAHHGQGWIDSGHNPEEIAQIVSRIQSMAREAGRAEVEFEFARQWYVSIGDTEEEARANFTASLPPPSGTAITEALQPSAGKDGGSDRSRTGPTRTLIGTPDYVRGELQKYKASGVTEMCTIFYSPNAEAAERQMKLFASEVAGKF
jgi:probable F420-dependent oxidoreductase